MTKKSKCIRMLDSYGYRYELDLADGKTVIVEAQRVNFGHNDFDTIVSVREKK